MRCRNGQQTIKTRNFFMRTAFTNKCTSAQVQVQEVHVSQRAHIYTTNLLAMSQPAPGFRKLPTLDTTHLLSSLLEQLFGLQYLLKKQGKIGSERHICPWCCFVCALTCLELGVVGRKHQGRMRMDERRRVKREQVEGGGGKGISRSIDEDAEENY